MKKFLFFAMFTLPVILTGCKKDNNRSPNPSTVPALSLNKSSLTLFLGYADTLQVTGTQSSTSITWATSNDSVATVTNGVILAVGRGTATITAKILGGSNTASCNVSVNDMSNVIGVSNELILLNDSTERLDKSHSEPYASSDFYPSHIVLKSLIENLARNHSMDDGSFSIQFRTVS